MEERPNVETNTIMKTSTRLIAQQRRGFILMAVALLLGLQGMAANPPPDLTRDGKPDNEHRWTLGATGARGWVWSRNFGGGIQSDDARQVLITEVAKGSPADGVLKKGDVVTGLNGQAFGGISHSIGFALSENYDDVHKHTNIDNSGVPYIKDIPDEIILVHMEQYNQHGPWGSSGASEAFQASGHVAVLNAIANATGVRIFEMPATKEKVKAGLDLLASGGRILPPRKYFLGSDLYEELEGIKANPVPFGGNEFYQALGGAGERPF